MKKIFSAVIVLSLVFAIFSGCASKKYVGEINVCNWGEYIDESVLKDFTRETNIKVNYTTFSSNETLYSNIKNGATNYDVIIPSDYMIARMIDEGMLSKLDYGNIPNFSLIGDEYKNMEYDPADEFSVPYMWGTVGIIYNSEMIGDEVTSWSALFNPDYSGQILMFDNPRDAFGIALLYLGYSLNTTDENEINEAYDLLKTQKPIVQAYVMDQIFDKLESGEAAIGPYYAGDYLSMLENNPDLKFVVPEEGSNVFVDAMCVPVTSSNKAHAEAFINFMTSTDVSIANMDEIGYSSPNSEAAEEYGAELDELSYNVMFPSAEVLEKCEVFKHLPAATLDMYKNLWIKLKS